MLGSPRARSPDELQPAWLARGLEGRYAELQLYSGGGDRNVYLGLDVKGRRKVNLHILRSDRNFGEYRSRLEREIELAAPLFHPNILPVYDIGATDGFVYYVTPHVEGRWLSARLEGGKLLLAETVRVMTDVARALAYCHEQDVLHCDLKPDTVLAFDTHVSICGFGIARRCSEGFDPLQDRRAEIAPGTPLYMSPEQWSGEALDRRTDLYSLGVIAFECLTGQNPFEGPSLMAIAERHLLSNLPTPALRNDAERSLFQVIRKLLARKRDDRYESAADLLVQLEEFHGIERVTRERPTVALEPYAGAGQYLFVTYVREDLETVWPIMQRMSRAGYHVWYDKGIPGGAEWDDVIEERIQACSGMVYFLSERSVNSKFARREVKYADTLDKRIVTIRLDDARAAHGLQMLLTQYQMLDVREAGPDDVARALGFVHEERALVPIVAGSDPPVLPDASPKV